MQPIGVPRGNEVKHAAYLDHLHSGALSRQQRAVMRVLALATVALTRHEIAERAGMALSASCGRVAELMHLDYIEVAGTKREPGARSARSALRLTDKGRVELSRIEEEQPA